MDFRHFAWAKSCNFLRDDLTHLGDSFKLLITKIGDRPVGPYPWIGIIPVTPNFLNSPSRGVGFCQNVKLAEKIRLVKSRKSYHAYIGNYDKNRFFRYI